MTDDDADEPVVRGYACVECGGQVSGKKPYCAEHIDRLPYVQRIYSVLEGREDEVRLLDKLTAPPETRAREILMHLMVKPATVARLSIFVEMEKERLSRYVALMRRRGLVRLVKEKSSKGIQRAVVALTAEGEAIVREVMG